MSERHEKNEPQTIGIDWAYYGSDQNGDYRFGQKGWICPKCGSIYSPMTIECYRCNKR